jgi:hypothetical protein
VESTRADHVGGAHVRLDAFLQAPGRGRFEPLHVDAAADDIRPGARLGEALYKPKVRGLKVPSFSRI